MALEVTGGTTPYQTMAGQIFWRGADGNIYVKGAGGNSAAVTNMGSSAPTWDYVLRGAVQVDDPGNGGGGGGTDLTPTYSNGGGSGRIITNTDAARGATQVSIDSLDTILANKNQAAEDSYNEVTGAYDAEDAANLAAYQKQVTGNEQQREVNHQAALAGAAQGQRGLFATLASIGALGGTGRILAGRAVAKEANEDIGNANKTFDNNATTLFDARTKLEQQEKQRRLDAKKIRDDQKLANEYEKAENSEKLWKDMADLWTKAGNDAEAANSMARASNFTTQRAAATRPNVGQYARTPLQWGAPQLAQYLAGANDMTVKTSSGGQPINGAIYTSTKERERV